MKTNSAKLISSAVIFATASLTSILNAGVIDFEDVSFEGSFMPTPSADGVNDWYSGSGSIGNFAFTSSYGGYAWEGFKASKASDTSDKTYANDCCSALGGGAGGSEKYAVFYGMCNTSYSTNTAEFYFAEAVNLVSIDLSNTAYSQNSILNGDGFAAAFGSVEGEVFFDLKLRGIDAEGNYSDYLTVSLGAKDADGTVTTLGNGGWETVSLDSLNMDGGLLGLEFSIAGSPNIGSNGWLNTPTYVALDNVAYSAIPEPAEWAAIFGALALVLAARKRKA